MVTMLSSLVYITTQTIAPDYGFDLSTDAVLNDVDIVFDDMAVPHIYADSETDAMHALGYVHAQDRFWQMELMRRIGQGRLAELVPPALVGAYYNPLTMAVTAMLVPNLVRLSLLVRKYAPKAKDRVLGAIKSAIKQRCGDTAAGIAEEEAGAAADEVEGRVLDALGESDVQQALVIERGACVGIDAALARRFIGSASFMDGGTCTPSVVVLRS